MRCYELLFDITRIDIWFISKIDNIVKLEARLREESLSEELLREAKRMEFPDKLIASLGSKTKDEVKKLRHTH